MLRDGANHRRRGRPLASPSHIRVSPKISSMR